MNRTLITGAGGLVGSALTKHLLGRGNDVIQLKSRQDLDLTSAVDVRAFFRETKPQHVYHLAASVFGVGGNLRYPADVFYRNTIMNTELIEAARAVGVKKIVAMGSAAMYSDGLSQPMSEDDAMAGEPHGSEYAYAFSKRTMFAQLAAYKAQYGLESAFVIATNMYGPHDRFDPVNGHVVPSLLKKFLDAEKNGSSVEIWGDGSPTRDFLYSADAAVGLEKIMTSGTGAYNLATGAAVPIRALVETISAEFPGVEFHWNTSKPLGQLSRSYDVTRVRSLGFAPTYDLAAGIKATVAWLRENEANLR